MSNEFFERLNEKAVHQVHKKISASSVNKEKLAKVVEFSQAVLGFAAIFALVKAGFDANKLVAWRLNGMSEVANWHIIKTLAFMSIIGVLIYFNFLIADALKIENEILTEIEEI